MLTHRMLGLLQGRLAANAPQQAGSHEYLAGVDDAVAAVCRLVEAQGTSTTTWLPEQPARTRLAAEYLQLEMTSLVWMIDSELSAPSPDHPGDEGLANSALLEARAHLVRARAALLQTPCSEAG